MISRCVQSSWWPVLFRADSTSTHHVSRRVTFLSWLITLSLVLLGIASVITPLGLSDSIRPTRTISSTFRYAPDRSAFGFGTPPRYKRFARLCGMTYMTNCPGRFDGVSVYYNSSDGRNTVKTTVTCDRLRTRIGYTNPSMFPRHVHNQSHQG